MILNDEQMRARADALGYDLDQQGRGKRAMYTATYRATGEQLCPTMGLAATMRLIQVDTLRRTAPYAPAA